MTMARIGKGTVRELTHRRLAIVELGEGDRALIHDHFVHLNKADRISRFQTPLSDVALCLHVGRIDFNTTIMIGALWGRTHLIGLAEAHLDREGPPSVAEIGITVHPEARGQGLGRRLVGQAVEHAFARGAFAVEFNFLPENRAVAQIAAALGARVDRAAGYAALTRPAIAAAA